MENEMSCDHNLLIDVLTEGEEIARQLEALLDEHSASEQCKSWAQKVRSKIRAAISMATEGSLPLPCPNNTCSDSPRSNSESPRSENSDRVFKNHERREISKKSRKTLPKWTSQVRVSSGAGYEVPLDDGYSWRKYGQKDILGAKYPRGYYRCTHRPAQGCLATKQVQRSDEDPTAFDVTYRGDHTCQQKTHLAPVQQNQQNPPPDKDDQQLLSSFRAGLQVKTEGLGSEDQDPASTSFSFPSTPVSCTKPETHHEFSSSFALDHHHHLMGSFSPTFFSPTTADSAYFSVSQCPMSGGYAGGQSDLANIVSAATSAANSPTVDTDFLLEQFNINFPFDNPNFFS